jgi:hypothetical protein
VPDEHLEGSQEPFGVEAPDPDSTVGNGNRHYVQQTDAARHHWRHELYRQMFRDVRLTGTADPFFNRIVRSRRT